MTCDGLLHAGWDTEIADDFCGRSWTVDARGRFLRTLAALSRSTFKWRDAKTMIFWRLFMASLCVPNLDLHADRTPCIRDRQRPHHRSGISKSRYEGPRRYFAPMAGGLAAVLTLLAGFKALMERWARRKILAKQAGSESIRQLTWSSFDASPVGSAFIMPDGRVTYAESNAEELHFDVCVLRLDF